MSNKDIEILKEFIKNYNEVQEKYKDDEIQAEIERSCYFEEVPAQAIENVLKALEGKDCVIETQAHNEEVYEELVEKLEKELETYKKIAYFLGARYWLKDYECADRFEKLEDVLSWARKEVENEI